MSPDLGAPVSYLTLAEGVPVLSADGHELGEVRHVLADEETDIFDGLVVRAGGRDVFADASQVDELYERGAVLTLDREAAERLPEPSENPAVLSADPDDTAPHGLGDKLRRAWDLLSGNY
jgi:hypothetical protein